MKWNVFSAILFLLVSAVACTTAPAPRQSVEIEMVGDDSMQWLAHELANVYTQQRPYVQITIRSATSDLALSSAREYSNTIGLVAREIKPAELEETRAVVVARDGIAVIVNRNNPINAIMRSQIAEVFSGQVLTWPTGPDTGKPITIISREDGSGTRDAFEVMVMNGVRVTRAALIMPSEVTVVDYVAHHSEAIAYASMGALTPDVRALTIDDIPLSPQTVEQKQYPFIRALAFVVAISPDPDVQDFVDFATSTEGQRIVAQKFGRAQ